MALDPTFDLFHRYNRLVRRSLVKPLACPHCGTNYTLGIADVNGGIDKLILDCRVCDSYVVPGENTVAQVRAVVKEHFSE